MGLILSAALIVSKWLRRPGVTPYPSLLHASLDVGLYLVVSLSSSAISTLQVEVPMKGSCFFLYKIRDLLGYYRKEGAEVGHAPLLRPKLAK